MSLALPTVKRREGFTIVELLIVIVVIGILAAITVVAYAGIQNRANDATVRSDAATAVKKLELARVDLGRYPVNISEFSSDFKFSKGSYLGTSNNALYCVNRTTDQYALGLISKSAVGFMIISGVLSENVSVTSTSVCAAVGTTWVNNATTQVIHGYNVGTGVWHSTWSWTN